MRRFILERPIGVIDSGVGGLTVVHELMRQLPREKLIYLGDTKRCPYGSRSEQEIKQFTWEMVVYLIKQNIKILVIACNTATAYTLKELQAELSIPVIGVIRPGARTAIKETNNNEVGIIGTDATIRSGAYPRALKGIHANIIPHSLACPPFVPMVEAGVHAGPKADRIVSDTLAPLKKTNIDTLILGCTHYPLIRDTIQKAMGEAVTVISSSEETARETSAMLEVHHLLNEGNHTAKHLFYTTGELELFTKITQTIFQDDNQSLQSITIHQAKLQS